MINDLRDFINQCEQSGELQHIKAEVDWNLEISHVCKINEGQKGPALLFENIKGCPGWRLLGSALCSPRRLGIAMNMQEKGILELAKEWTQLTGAERLIPPRIVSEGPILENQVEGEAINLLSLPVPHFMPLDGGRYLGTAVCVVTQDPDSSWFNVGTYRMMLLDEKRSAMQFHIGKHADLMLDRYREMKKTYACSSDYRRTPIAIYLVLYNCPLGCKRV